ncbi:MAG: arginine--tRNA ligase [Endomicrobiales bacterium]|nr:arginine--tRNA ligase [Endomicrobiales bacterium]
MFKKLIKIKVADALKEFIEKNSIDNTFDFAVEQTPKNIPSDFAINAAMLLAKKLKTNPHQLAQELCPQIQEALKGIASKVEVAGAGFINVYLSDEFTHSCLKDILDEKGMFGKSSSGHNESVLIEFVSANPTGPLHIGHGRGAAIGDSLARIFSHAGYNVTKEYYINDAGNQMENLGKSVQARYLELKGEKTEFPEDGYHGQYINDIAKKLFDENTQNINFTQVAIKEIMQMIKSDLSAFDVEFDTWFSEKTLASITDSEGKTEVDKACEYLQRKEMAYEKDGALWFASEKFGDDKDRVLKRDDGRYTYIASDIAYHKNKLERGYTKLINLWGADHHGYVARLKASIEALGSNPEALTIILYQLVSLMRNGKPVVMSTRSGEFIALQEVIDEVGKDACRFFFLLRAPGSQLDFDLELAKKQSSENPVFYIQYVYARCASILAQAKKNNLPNNDTNSDIDLSVLTQKDELALIKQLALLPDVVDNCIKNLSPHFLTTYLMETADNFHRFYENCKVLCEDEKVSKARLALVEAVMTIVRNTMWLLGVSTPDKM